MSLDYPPSLLSAWRALEHLHPEDAIVLADSMRLAGQAYRSQGLFEAARGLEDCADLLVSKSWKSTSRELGRLPN
jgi:hypothetical protein